MVPICQAALRALFVLIILQIMSVDGQSNQTYKTIVTNSDPWIMYSPAACQAMCPGAWWDTYLSDGTMAKTTMGPTSGYNNAQTTLTYTFMGSSLEIYGMADAEGANAIVQIDNFLVIVNTSTGIGGASMSPRMLYNISVLNPATTHTLSIGWSANRNPDIDAGGFKPISYVYFDHLEIGDLRVVNISTSEPLISAASSTSASSTTTPSATAESSRPSAGSKRIAAGAVAGIVTSVLVVLLLCFLGICFLTRHGYRPFRHLRRPTPGIRVMIESRETSESITTPSPTQSESWKPRPHMSLPPAYYGGTNEVLRKAGCTTKKGESYLDLESGNSDSLAPPAPSGVDASDVSQRPKSSKSLLSVNSPSSRSARVSYPPRAKEKAEARKSVRLPRNHPFTEGSSSRIQDDQMLSPLNPFTPYYLGAATVTRPQIVPLVRKSVIAKGKLSTSSEASEPLPPLPPIPVSPEETSHRVKQLRSSRRSRGKTRIRPMTNDVNANDPVHQLPTALDTDLGTRPNDARPSFDTISIMTRSVPPPYALHV